MNPELIDAIPVHIRKQWAEQDQKNAKLAENLRIHCADALACLADAMRNPNSSRTDLEAAQKHLLRALSIAAVLDPE